MKQRSATCPACAGPVIFGFGTVVAICEFCNSAVARGDKRVEDYGKVADIAETSSRLRRGLTGKYKHKEFTIAGRVQYRHPAGGIWDEWYLHFADGRWGWLAEAQGRCYLTFDRRLKHNAVLPKFDDLEVGQELDVAGLKLSVVERGIAENAAAEGEIPWKFQNGGQHQFVDMRDDTGRFATLEYADEPVLYCGHEIALDDLQLVGEGWQLDDEKIATSALQLNCPKCAGQLVLRAPDEALRVTCPHCNAMLDADHGKLSYLKTLKSKERFPLAIPLGSEGELFGVKYTVIGFMRRYAVWSGQTFPWNEYLLYEQKAGFRWLVHNSRHWSFVESVEKPMPAIHALTKKVIQHDGAGFRVYDRGEAFVRYVIGEFYWKVSVGDKARTADFIAPPRMLSFEWSGSEKSKEVNISLGHYLTTDEIEKAFGVKDILRPMGVGVIQPAPTPGRAFYLVWAGLVAFLILMQIVFRLVKATEAKPDPWLCFYGVLIVTAVPIAVLMYRYSFEAKRWEDSDFNPYATE